LSWNALLRTAGSESFWADQCVDEIDKHAERHKRGQGIVENHGSHLKPVAGDGVDNRQDKKSHTCSDEDGIKHGELLKPVARERVEKREDKKTAPCSDEDCIKH
jgi:hypothetical protein